MKAGERQELERTLIGDSCAIRSVRETVARLASHTIPVFILGETGTGKELVARALHGMSSRSRALISCNVAAVSASLFEDALFGHERGAFSGADRQTNGMLAAADQGTLFLDEITSLSPDLQPKLLRALDLGEYMRVGSYTAHRSHFRLVTAANESITECVARGAFRQDLAFRLRASVIQLPPLRDRISDIYPLAQYFAELRGLGIEATAYRPLVAHAWPGNVRELRNLIDHASALCDHATLTHRDIQRAFDRTADSVIIMPTAHQRRRRELVDLLRRHDDDVTALSRALGKDRSTIYRYFRELGIAPPKRPRSKHALSGSGEDAAERKVAESGTTISLLVPLGATKSQASAR